METNEGSGVGGDEAMELDVQGDDSGKKKRKEVYYSKMKIKVVSPFFSVKSASTRPVAVTLASSHARGARVSSGGTFRRMPSSSAFTITSAMCLASRSARAARSVAWRHA